MSSVLFLVLFVLSQAKHLVSLFTSILQWVKHSTSFLLVWTFQAFFGSVEVRFWKEVWTCSAVLGLREREKKKRGRMTVQNKITIFVFVFVHKKHSFYLHRIWNGSLKCTVLAECTFIGTTVKLSQLSKQTADWWSCCDGWYCRGSSGAERRTQGKIFYLFCHGVLTNWCIWSQLKRNLYLCTYAKCFFCCWGQSRCAVCYGFSWQCCKWKQKKTKMYNNKFRRCSIKTDSHLVVFNMDSVWMFLLFLGNVY